MLFLLTIMAGKIIYQTTVTVISIFLSCLKLTFLTIWKKLADCCYFMYNKVVKKLLSKLKKCRRKLSFSFNSQKLSQS